MPSLLRAWNLKNITASHFTLNCPDVKRLGLHYRNFGTPLPLLKRLRGRFTPKNSAFWRRVEKVGLNTSTGDNKSPAYFLVVPPGHTATGTALNAEISKLH